MRALLIMLGVHIALLPVHAALVFAGLMGLGNAQGIGEIVVGALLPLLIGSVPTVVTALVLRSRNVSFAIQLVITEVILALAYVGIFLYVGYA